jgi:hypothetical protein
VAIRCEVYQAALEYLAGKLAVIPICPDGSKAPALKSWDEYKTRLPTEKEVQSWFGSNSVGVAIIGGQVSGNLGILDVEYPDFAVAWAELVESQDAGLVGALPQVITPGKSGQPGKHFYFRSPGTVRTGKLAHLTPDEAQQRTGDPRKTTAIELKAEGGYCLAPGCPPACHESGRLYQHVGGPFIEEVPVLTQAQVDILLSCARALDHAPLPTVDSFDGAMPPSTSNGGGDRPGDVFNRRAEWVDILEPHGWQCIRQRGEISYWRRPGKEKGVSATTGYCRNDRAGDLLCVFSSNASPLDLRPGQDHRCFSKFSAYAWLDHGGDFLAAARELVVRGYGFDLGMTGAEQFAEFLFESVEDLDNQDILADLRQRLTHRNAEKNWGLSNSELDAVLTEAKRLRIEHDPKLFADQVHREIAESAALPASQTAPGTTTPAGPPGTSGPPPAWHLVILESIPPEYLLRCPRWSSQPKLTAKGGYIHLKVKELATWQGLRDAALAQADVRIPDKIKGWPRLLQRLLDNGEHRAVPAESQRPLLVAEYLWNCLRRAKDVRTNDDGTLNYGSGGPVRLQDGRVALKSKWLVDHATMSADAFTRKELTDCMQAYNMRTEQIGNSTSRSRWWTINQVNMDRMEADSNKE